MSVTSFYVAGKPEPQGSMSAYSKAGRVIVTSANPKLKQWRQQIAAAAERHARVMLNGPVEVDLLFYLPRPKSAPKSRTVPTVRPDADKLARAVLDALTGICFTDDSQVTCLYVAKKYERDDVKPGVRVLVSPDRLA